MQSGNDGKEMYKKSVVVLLIKPIAFLPFSLPSASSLLKLPNDPAKRSENKHELVYSIA